LGSATGRVSKSDTKLVVVVPTVAPTEATTVGCGTMVAVVVLGVVIVVAGVVAVIGAATTDVTVTVLNVVPVVSILVCPLELGPARTANDTG
jgi:hypothetical protein